MHVAGKSASTTTKILRRMNLSGENSPLINRTTVVSKCDRYLSHIAFPIYVVFREERYTESDAVIHQLDTSPSLLFARHRYT